MLFFFFPLEREEKETTGGVKPRGVVVAINKWNPSCACRRARVDPNQPA
jgi:hypothetical protein